MIIIVHRKTAIKILKNSAKKAAFQLTYGRWHSFQLFIDIIYCVISYTGTNPHVRDIVNNLVIKILK